MGDSNKSKPLLEKMREVLRRQGYAYATETTYCDWVSRFIKFHSFKNKAPLLSNAEERVEQYLTHLAVKKYVAPSTQNQALNALVFLYNKVLQQPLENVSATRSRKEPRIPVVLSKEEVKKILTLFRWNGWFDCEVALCRWLAYF